MRHAHCLKRMCKLVVLGLNELSVPTQDLEIWKTYYKKQNWKSSQAMRPLPIFKRGLESMSILTPFFIYESVTHITCSLAQLSQIIYNPHCCMIAANSYHIMTRVSREKRQDTGWSFEFLKIPTVTWDGVKRWVSSLFSISISILI